MRQTTVTFVHTEYHLLLFVNKLINEQDKGIENDHILYIEGQNGFRIPENLNFTSLPITVRYVSEKFKANIPLNNSSKKVLNSILSIKPDNFIFFQENDLLYNILADYWKRECNTKIMLFQDGLKAYNILKYGSLGLMKLHHQYNLWMKRNGFTIDSWFSPFWSHRYAYIKDIDEVHLTFPEAYINWNNQNLKKIEFLNIHRLKFHLEKIYNWNDNLLSKRKDVIFYLSQPMHDDGVIEEVFIQKLLKKFPEKDFYLKLHPNIQQHKVDVYKKYPNIKIITKRIPAELYIMQLTNSLVISMNSTSMFLNNPKCKFFYIHKLFRNDIKRLRRYDIKVHPAPHIILTESIEEIKF